MTTLRLWPSGRGGHRTCSDSLPPYSCGQRPAPTGLASRSCSTVHLMGEGTAPRASTGWRRPSGSRRARCAFSGTGPCGWTPPWHCRTAAPWAVPRIGRTTDRTGAAKRIHNLLNGPLPGALLVLTPDLVSLRHAQRLLAAAGIRVFLTVESDAGGRPAGGAGLAPAYHRGGPEPAVRVAPSSARRNRASGAAAPECVDATRRRTRRGCRRDSSHTCFQPCSSPPRSTPLDLVFDWPWITAAQLAGMLGVREERVQKMLGRLEECGLVGGGSGWESRGGGS